MKKYIAIILFLSALTISLSSCKDKTKQTSISSIDTPKNTGAPANSETYKANTETSNIEWKGFKPTGEHFGTVSIENGTLDIANGKITGGSFNINMTSIIVTDIPAEEKGNAKLLSHLKSEDFFNTETHPKASFTVTGSELVEGKTMLSGDLIIKGISNNISFPVTVTQNENDLTLSSEAFTIDRTKWEIKYKSKSIFGDLGYKFINDDIELKILVEATKS